MSQPLTTVDKVKLTAPELVGDISDSSITQLIEDAQLLVLSDGFPKQIIVGGEDVTERIWEQAERYLTLHMIASDGESSRGIQSEQVDVLKTTYFSKSTTNGSWIKGSEWGLAYWRLWLRYGKDDRFNFVVVNH